MKLLPNAALSVLMLLWGALGLGIIVASQNADATEIPATPVMTLYQFNGPVDIPYYEIGADGPGSEAGTLSQGTSVIPCLVVRDGQALSDDSGTPFVGFEILVDSRKASDASDTQRFEEAFQARRTLRASNHHCGPKVRHVLDIRNLYALNKSPKFNPPGQGDPQAAIGAGQSQLDAMVRAFHNGPQCASVNATLIGRRDRLATAWEEFIEEQTADPAADGWTREALEQAKHLDYAMRTALFEGHLDRGCSAYGACERNVVVLSIRNRAIGQCLPRQGCAYPGDFQGVSSDPSQYNIWDEYLTQISGLTGCFMRTDLADQSPFARIQRMYAQNIRDMEQILFGDEIALDAVFPGNTASTLTSLRHYYHPPAMGKCFPDQDRVEYMTGALARKGNDWALIANTRVRIDEAVGEDWLFQEFLPESNDKEDISVFADNYPGFILDGRKVELEPSHGGCTAYGVSRSCRFEEIGRYRRTPLWLTAGEPLALNCRIQDQGESCSNPPREVAVAVGGSCDVDMMPVSGVR